MAYFTSEHIVPFMSDVKLSLVAPVATYWIYSSIYEVLDYIKLDFFERCRIHPSIEMRTRNQPTLKMVIRDVIIQQIVQVSVQIFIYKFMPTMTESRIHISNLPALVSIVNSIVQSLGYDESVATKAISLLNSLVIPTLQIIVGFLLIDTWQYFWHRWMHENRYLYRKIHSHHHRIFVPFAYGALYNHVLEGLILDTIGAGLAYVITGMSLRVGLLFFCLSTMKTVDDHCGYRFWWDPAQFLFNNNVEYHDIHHQPYGFMYNYSQPFYTHWDKWLGTYMSYEKRDMHEKKLANRREKTYFSEIEEYKED